MVTANSKSFDAVHQFECSLSVSKASNFCNKRELPQLKLVYGFQRILVRLIAGGALNENGSNKQQQVMLLRNVDLTASRADNSRRVGKEGRSIIDAL